MSTAQDRARTAQATRTTQRAQATRTAQSAQTTRTAQDRARAARTPPWGGASLFPNRAGVPGWAAVFIALALTAAGVVTDLHRIDRLGLLFLACYFLGCLSAIILVERRGLFAPTVQPPLILVCTVPGAVLLGGGAPARDGLTATVLAVGTPLINSFPTMAVTTGVTVAVGLLRLITQRAPAPGRPAAPRSRPNS
ncbi:MAG: hypothetical protein M3308_02040 [Actinomycetota bacterium]|nr:hypothetical protein [Actinomycetota bacterium]